MFDCTLDNLLDTLDEWGIAVLSLISDEEADYLADEAVGYLEDLNTGLNRNDYSTWITSSMPLGPKWGMYQSIVSHSPFMWRLRELSSPVFEHIWDTEDVVFSIDAASIYPPKESIIREKENDWPHLDQTERGLKCYQGQVVLTDTTAAFRATPRSHLVHDDILDELDVDSKKKMKNWYKFSKSEIRTVQEITSEVYEDWQIPIRVRKGSMILWDSRVIHSACRQDINLIAEGDQSSPLYDWRCVGYVCARPRDHYSKRSLKTLQRSVEEGRTTNHWGSRMFAKKPRYKEEDSEMMKILDDPESYMTEPYMEMMYRHLYV